MSIIILEKQVKINQNILIRWYLKIPIIYKGQITSF